MSPPSRCDYICIATDEISTSHLMYLNVVGGLSEAPISEPEVSNDFEPLHICPVQEQVFNGTSPLPARLGYWLRNRILGNVSGEPSHP